MFVPFLIFFLPVALGPAWLFWIYDSEIKYQEEQILIDNTAIQVGRADRDGLNELKKMNDRLQTLHDSYHKALACILVPATSHTCRILAQKLSESIRLLIASMEVHWKKRWAENTKKIQVELNGRGRDYRVVRALWVFLDWHRCSICQKPSAWTIHAKKLKTQILAQRHPDLRISFSAEKKVGKWTYRMWSEP